MTAKESLLKHVDTSQSGPHVPWSFASFTAGFLQQWMESDQFSKHESETRERTRLLSLVAHLVIKCSDFSAVFQHVAPLLKDIQSGSISWEDDKYFAQRRQEILDSVQNDIDGDNGYDNNGDDMYDDYSDYEDGILKVEAKFVKEEADDEDDPEDNVDVEDEEGNVKKEEDEPEAKVLKITKPSGEKKRKRDRVWTEEDNEKRKQRGRAPKQPRMCTECGKEFKDLSHHMRNEHNITWHKCPKDNCNYKAKHEYELKRHLIRAHTDEEVTTCPYCGDTTRNLRSHINNRKCDRPELAQQLKEEKERRKEEKEKARDEELANTLGPCPDKGKGGRPAKSKTCPVCFKEFPLRKTMMYHWRYKHQGTKFYCSVEGCSFVSSTSSSRNRHELTVHQGVKFYCDQCSFSTSQSYALNQHMIVHNEGGFKCEECDYVGPSDGSLRDHMRKKHLGLKYQCDQCDWIGVDPSNFKRHVEFRHQGKTYNCDICGIKMASKSGLTFHIKQQHGGKKFNCEQCDYKACSKSRLKEHVEAKHDERVDLFCNICSFKTKAPRRIKEHMRKHETAIC